jgi:hypothetical protein
MRSKAAPCGVRGQPLEESRERTGVRMTVISTSVLLALIVFAGEDRRPANAAVPPGAAAPGAAQPAAKGPAGAAIPKGPVRDVDRWPALEGDQGAAAPPTPVSPIDAIPIPFRQSGPRGAAAGPALGGRTLAMPPNPFPTVPPGATALRKPATYGMQVGPAPAIGAGKAFGNYQPSSPISPYMSLYAPRTLGVDNYNAYVRPQLQQQAFNQQIDTSFRTLDTDRAQQEATNRTLEQLYMTGPGISGATYMNLQPYYPNYPNAK